MRIDNTKTPQNNFWALIDGANSTGYDSSTGFLLSAPTVVSGRSDGHNTKVTVSVNPGGTNPVMSQYQGSQDFYYSRLGLLQNVTTPPAHWTLNHTSFSAVALFAQIVSDLGLIASEVMFVETLVANMPTITLRPNASSLLYVGDSVLNLLWT